MKFLLLLIPALFFLFTSTSSADMYQWVDEYGVITFKDTPPPQKKKRVKVKIYTDDDFSPAPARTSGNGTSSGHKTQSKDSTRITERARFTGTIEMYVTEWCPVCKNAEKYIIRKNYPYIKYDIEKDGSAKQRFEELGGHGVPLILVGSKRMSGFSAQLLDQYMGGN